MKILFNELKKYKLSLLLILVGTYISTVLELTIPLLLANALNIGIVENYGLNYIKRIVIMMIYLIIITILLNTIINYLIARISINSSTNIKNSLFEKILSLKNEELNKFTIPSLINRTNQDIEQTKNFVSSFISVLFKAPILFISCITILKTLNKSFSYILLVAVTVIVIYLIFIIIKITPISKKIELKLDKITSLLKEKLTGFKIIKSYNNLEKHDQKFKKATDEYLSYSKKAIRTTSFIMPVLNLLINFITIIVLSICTKLVSDNVMEVGTIVATVQYILQILLSVIMISMVIILIPTTKVSLDRIQEVLSSKSYENQSEEALISLETISFENVELIKNDNHLLTDINLTINNGENIGIIGLTGSGKSLLAKLLLKETEVTKGKIKINNININKLSRKEITSNITYLPQNISILKGSILENITFANQQITKNEIDTIIKTCVLDNFINKNNQGLNYLLEENGSNLSGGQKQRIALARALAKKSDCLLLDDPFSSLDYKTEKIILNNLKEHYNKTLIIISQRISSLSNCKKIIVMDKGKIIAIDNHQNLLKSCSLYKEIYLLQKEVVEYDI